MRRRAAPCFANADADPGQDQVHDVRRKARQGRHTAPDSERQRNQVSSVGPVRNQRYRYPERGIEKGESRSRQKTENAIIDGKLGFDRRQENCENLAINKIEGIDNDQQAERISPRAFAYSLTLINRVGRADHQRSTSLEKRSLYPCERYDSK